MNRENLEIMFGEYIARFAELNEVYGHDEGYKWRAESCFVQNWDIDAADFPAMFRAATKEMSNLIDNKSVQPIGGILDLLKREQEVEFVRNRFRELFAEDFGDLSARQERIFRFMDNLNERIDHYHKGSWKFQQRLRDVIYYVNLWRPQENYIFKSEEANDWANCVEFAGDFGSGSSFSLATYYRMCDELLVEAAKNEDIMKLHCQRFEREADGFDDCLHILVYDIIYCAHAYNFYASAKSSAHSAKERKELAAKRAVLEEAERTYEALLEQRKDLANVIERVVNLVGAEFFHRVNGAGKVVNVITDSKYVYLEIAFSSKTVKFVYPDAVQMGHIVALDAELSAAIVQQVKAKGKLDAIEKELKQAEKQVEAAKQQYDEAMNKYSH